MIRNAPCTRHKYARLVSIFLLPLLLVSCGTASRAALASTTTSSTTTTVPPRALKLTFAAPFLPQNFNPNTPAGDQSITREVMVNVWPSVFYENSKYLPVLNSALMTSAELVSTNPEKIVYKINPKAVWSDGVPISASDFIFNWKAQLGDRNFLEASGSQYLANSTVGYGDIKSMTASNGGKTVTVIFKKYFSEWESLFNPLVPAHIAQRIGWNSGFEIASPTVEVSGGPYQISEVIPGKEIKLTRNPHYWAKPAVIPELVFLDDPNPNDYPAQFANGSLNLVDARATDLLYSNLKALKNVSTSLVPSHSILELLFNLSKSPLSDPQVREAIALAIDRKAIVQSALGSYDSSATPAGNNIYAPGEPQYQNDGSGYLTSNPAKAVDVLLADGYTRSSKGIMTKDGRPLVLTMSVDSSSSQLLYVEEMITEELSAVGIVVNPDNYPSGVLDSSVLSKGNFDMAIAEESASPNATFHVSRYQSSGTQSNDNYMHYSSKLADTLISKAYTELDPATSAKIYNQLDQLIWKDLPSIPLYSVPNVLAYNVGYNFIANSTSSSTVFWNSSAWSYIPQK